MNIVRRLAIWALLTVFFGSLLFIAYGWTFNETLANRETVKVWFEKSGAYENFVDEIVTVSQAQAAEEGNVVDAEILTEAANKSFTPELLQESLERVLDGGYDWLEGKNNDVEFVVDFGPAKESFAENLTAIAVERVDDLPACTTLPESRAFDPFTAECVPFGLDFAAQARDFKQLIVEDENFLEEPRIVASDITLGDEDNPKTLGEAASAVPVAYQLARLGAVIALVLAFATATLMLVIAKSKRKAVVKLFRGFLFTAISLAIFTFISSRSTAWLDTVLATNEASAGFTERIIKPLVATAAEDMTTWTLRFTIMYAIIAAVLLVGLLYHHVQWKKHKKQPRTKEFLTKLEHRYRRVVSKKPKKYKKSYTKNKEKLKKKTQKKKKP